MHFHLLTPSSSWVGVLLPTSFSENWKKPVVIPPGQWEIIIQNLELVLFRHLITTILYYVHRYLRLTIPYALVLAVIVAVLPHLASGPQWSLYVGASEVPSSLLAIKTNDTSQELQDNGVAKLTLCERSHR